MGFAVWEVLMDMFQKIGNILKKQNISALLVCVAGIALNMLLGIVVSALELPLYLDTVGTVAVAAMGGYLPGVIVGFATNVIKSISDPPSLYYVSLNVLIAYFAAFLSRRGWLKKPLGILGMIIVFVLIGGGLGALIPWFMESLTFDSESLSEMLFETGYFGLLSSHLLSSIIVDIPDKAITVLLVLAILRFVPESSYKYCSLRWWAQAPAFYDETSKSDTSDIRVVSLKGKVIIAQAVSLLIISIVGIALSTGVYRNTIIEEHSRIAQGTAEMAASIINGDIVDDYLQYGYEADGYRETFELLSNILHSSTDIKYLYVYKISEDGCHVVFDIDVDDVEAEDIGAVIDFDEGFYEYLPALFAGEKVDPIITNDQWGYLLTAYQPVYDSDGKCVCYAGADVDLGLIDTRMRSFLMEMISIYVGFFIVLCVFVNWMAEYQISLPIKTITKRINDFTHIENDQKELDENVRNFRSIDVHTGDEVEVLYNAISRMTSNQSEQMRSIRRLSDSTAKMQDGLIITMADMVENRDSDTGAHIQKTAAYVKIIVEGLKKKGYYAEKLTPKFMSDVVRSAPLHDIGKINIPDEVLNKPGKLTDEEYEIMKTHTTAGKRIMEHAISTVEGDNYLKEARNMAAYHHERWDGKGYPEKLHGEVIPLSARIMAVADVFDALTSPRVYKPAFPLEKALSIIEEGKGTQFDPKCVEVFMDSLDEVKVVLGKYNQEV